MSSVLIGASRAEQIHQNILSLDIQLTPEQQARLDKATALPLLNPYFIFDLPIERIFGGQKVEGWKAGR